MKKRPKWWRVTWLDVPFLIIVVLIFWAFGGLGSIKAWVYAFPVMMVYWIVGHAVRGTSRGPRKL